MGILGYFLTPILMGSGFKPSITMTITGLSSEILLMKCLYELSTSPHRFSQNVFTAVCLFQTLVLGLAKLINVDASITIIWFSSCVVYLSWLIANWFGDKK